MPAEMPWYGYPVCVVVYLIIEACYRAVFGKFLLTHMLAELLETIEGLKVESYGDAEGGRLCAMVVRILLVMSPVLILVHSIASTLKSDSTSDLWQAIVLLVFLLPLTLALSSLNEFWLSWMKKKRCG